MKQNFSLASSTALISAQRSSFCGPCKIISHFEFFLPKVLRLKLMALDVRDQRYVAIGALAVRAGHAVRVVVLNVGRHGRLQRCSPGL